MSVTCSPSGSGSGSSSKKLPVRPLGDLNTVKNQDGLSSDGDVLPLASFFLPVFRVAADIFARKPGCYQVRQPGWAIGARFRPRGAPTKSSIARRRTAPTGSPESSHRRFARDFPIEPARDTPPRRGAHWYSAARPNRPKLDESDPTGEGGSALSGARWAGRTAPRPLFQGHQKW